MTEATHAKRYWAYIHDDQGRIIATVLETDDMVEAINAACEAFPQLFEQDILHQSVRVIDLEQDGKLMFSVGFDQP